MMAEKIAEERQLKAGSRPMSIFSKEHSALFLQVHLRLHPHQHNLYETHHILSCIVNICRHQQTLSGPKINRPIIIIIITIT